MKFQYDILPEAQRALWPELKHTPRHFVLYGGTALALQLGHRDSIDFDFFSSKAFDPDELLSTIPYLKNPDILQKNSNTLTVAILPLNKTEPVNLSFFHVNLPQIKAPKFADKKIRIASVLDIFGMKCATIATRIDRKDYLDIHAILMRTDFNLNSGLAAAKAIYGHQYSSDTTIRALIDTKGLDLNDKVIDDLGKSVKSLISSKLPDLKAQTKIGMSIPRPKKGLKLWL